jgi:hypothetical protein
MIMKKYLALSLALMSTTALAQVQTGVGVSVQDSGSKIYVPINITEEFRIEPKFSYAKQSSDREDYSEFDFKIYELGIGLFGVKAIAPEFNFLYGLNLGLLRGSSENKYDGSENKYESEMKGVSLSHIVGFEYYFVENISIGSEVALVYSKLDETYSSSFDDEDDKTTQKTIATDTSLNIRFYF